MPNFSNEAHLSPAETAKRFGVSIKALRLYEQRGLLTPARTRNGSTGAAWRAYGPDQIARLHQILTLKRLGLPLARIGEILASQDMLAPVLALQEQILGRESDKLSRALELVRAARAKLASGQALSIDDLATLNQETVMTRPSYKEVGQILEPIRDQHFSPEDRKAMRAKLADPKQIARDIEAMTGEGQTLMQSGDPASPAAQDLARRWLAITGQFSDLAIKEKGTALWTEAMKDPATASRLALHQEIFAFINRAITHLKAQPK